MKINSSGIRNGIIEDKYGARGTQFIGEMPTYSLPVQLSEAPLETVCFALVLLDHDAVPPTGFTWIHWSVANLVRDELKENEAVHAKGFIQGTNSWSSPLLQKPLSRLEAATYGGMTPPDAPHTYELKAYALDARVELENGFYLNELYDEMSGHILDKAVIYGTYTNS